MRILKSLIGVGVACMLTASAYAQAGFWYNTVPSALNNPVDLGGGYTMNIAGTNTIEATCNPLTGYGNLIIANFSLAPNPGGGNQAITPTDFYVTLSTGPTQAAQTDVYNVHYRVSGAVGQSTSSVVIDYLDGIPPKVTYNGQEFQLIPQLVIPPGPIGSTTQGSANVLVYCPTIPEPGSMALLSVGLLPMLGLIRRRK